MPCPGREKKKKSQEKALCADSVQTQKPYRECSYMSVESVYTCTEIESQNRHPELMEAVTEL